MVLAHAQPRAVPDPQAVGRVHRQPDPAGHAGQPQSPTYSASGYKLKPLMRAILTHPLIFESIDEPNLIKPPMVYMVGVLRQLDAPLQGTPSCRRAMNNMQQRDLPAAERRGLGGRHVVAEHEHRAGALRPDRRVPVPASTRTTTTETPGTGRRRVNYPADIDGETAQAAYDRAYASVNKPWISAATRDNAHRPTRPR